MNISSHVTTTTPAQFLARIFVGLLVLVLLLFQGQTARASDLIAPSAASQSRLATDPLAGRLGSTRADFEATFGEPISAEPQPYPLGLLYALDDLAGTAYAFFEDDRLVALTLFPEDRGFSPLILPDVIDTFLPGDFTDGWVGDDTGELWVMNGTSPELDTVVESDVYEKYDASPDAGDLHMAVYITPDGNAMFEIQFRLGWRSQELDNLVDFVTSDDDEADDHSVDDTTDVESDRDDDRDAGTNDAEVEYIATLTASLETLNGSIDHFNAVITDPGFGSADSMNELIAIFHTWNLADREAQALTPPPGFEEIHDAYLGFTGALVAAAHQMAIGDIDAAAAEFAAAQEQAQLLADLLEDVTEPDVMDVKSGSVQR